MAAVLAAAFLFGAILYYRDTCAFRDFDWHLLII